MRKSIAIAVIGAVAVAGCGTKSSAPPTSSSSASTAAGSSQQLGQGVTATTIRVGITYPDLAAIRQTINVNAGNYQVAYTAVIDQINSQGGINGRKIVPYFSAVNPLGTAPAAESCAQLTEDDKVFVEVGFLQAADVLCYVATHDTPIVGQSLTAQQQAQAKATWFNFGLAPNEVVPKELSSFVRLGVFSGHKVAVVGQSADQAEMNVVLAQLKSLGVNVVQSAINDALITDTVALNAQYALIAQKFSAAGANVVVAVGTAGEQWPDALQINQSSYLPRLVATDYNDLDAYVSSKTGFSQAVLKNAITASGSPSNAAEWVDPAMQKCVALVQAAEPNTVINSPVNATSSTPVTYTAPITACQLIPMLVDILKAAGPTLNNASFLKGGESLTNFTIPGSGGTLHFGPGHHDDGPVVIYNWDASTSKLVSQASGS